MNARFEDELYLTRIILQFVLRNLDVFVAESDQGCIQFQYEPMVHHLRHQLLNQVRFLGGHVTSPINDVMVICLGLQRIQSNRGTFAHFFLLFRCNSTF